VSKKRKDIDPLGPAGKEGGQCYDAKKEPVPTFNSRNGDFVISGKGVSKGGENNNAWIVIGRDRPDTACSGYGGVGNTKSGAIDIVVGRMSPIPRSNFPGDKSDKIYVDPIFTQIVENRLEHKQTEIDKAMAAADTFDTNKLFEEAPYLQENTAKFSGVYNDAARIYISQKTDVDHNFRIKAGIKIPSPPKGVAPMSAIAMQADEVRMISRRGIKLVTLGAYGYGKSSPVFNSRGGRQTATYGIELIAGNGYDAQGNLLQQEPLVKGYQLSLALEKLGNHTNKLTGIVAELAYNQLKFNKALMSHTHGETFLGAITWTSMEAQMAGAKSIIDYISRTQQSIMSIKSNLAGWTSTWVGAGQGPKPSRAKILSDFNTTN